MHTKGSFAPAGADGVDPSFCTTIIFGSGSTQCNSSTEYVLNFSNFSQRQFRAGHFSNALRAQSCGRWATFLYRAT